MRALPAVLIAAAFVMPAAAQLPQASGQPPRPVWTVETLPPPAPLKPDPNRYANPYRSELSFLKMPAGRTMGSTSAVAVDSKGHIWVAERCGANSCATSTIDPIMEFDANGNFIKAFGGGLTNFPHGFWIDAQDNIWLTDARVGGGKGGVVMKFSADGRLLMTLGKPGIAGTDPTTFTEPNAVITGRDGTIFVSDGHEAGRRIARIVKFRPDGTFIKEWGTAGYGRDRLEVPHALALDSRGRLFVGDRWNNRVVIYSPDGKWQGAWTQFGRPSGLFIDAQDRLYSGDSESRRPVGYGYNPGWKRGIRVGSARTGKVTAFIPDPDPNPDAGATSGAEGIWVGRDGTIYGAQVKERTVARHIPTR